MKRIEALKIILAWWAFAYAIEGDDDLDHAFDWFAEEIGDPKISQAFLIWFGTINPSNIQITIFINIWGKVIKNKLFPNYPKYLLGQESLDDLITETILQP